LRLLGSTAEEKNPAGAGFFGTYFFFFLVAAFLTGFFLAAMAMLPSSIGNKRLLPVLPTALEKLAPERLPALI
jgi:hypothetical protein